MIINNQNNAHKIRSPERFTFSTDALPREQRFEACRAMIQGSARGVAQGAGLLELTSPTPDDFQMAIDIQPLGQVTHYDVKQGSECTTTMNDAEAQRSYPSFALQICRKGMLRGSQHGSTHEVNPGSALLMHIGAPGALQCLQGSVYSSLVIDPSRLRPLLQNDLPKVMTFITGDNAAMRLLTKWLEMLAGADVSDDPKLSAALEAHAFDLVALALGAKNDVREAAEVRSAKSVRIAAILDWIELNASRIDASAVEAAAEFGISDRYVRQILEETGRTFSEHILEQRLLLAFKMINNPQNAGRKIIDIAHRAGFSDVSYFNRAFRARFGDTPTGVRD